MNKTIQLVWCLALFVCSLTLFSCKKKIYDHCVIEITYPDQSKEMIGLCQDNKLLITLDTRQFILQTKALRENSADIEWVETTCVDDTLKQEFNILKINSQLDHYKLNQSQTLGSIKSGVVLEVISIAEMQSEELRKMCYGQQTCCLTSCASILCCIAGDECDKNNCDCKQPIECPNPKNIPSVLEFAKLLSREKINVKVPYGISR